MNEETLEVIKLSEWEENKIGNTISTLEDITGQFLPIVEPKGW